MEKQQQTNKQQQQTAYKVGEFHCMTMTGIVTKMGTASLTSA